MKAAPYYPDQLLDRVEKYKQLGIKPAIELHLFGSRDVFGENRKMVEENCRRIPKCDYITHFPIFDLDTGYIYDAATFDMSILEEVLDFCSAIGSHYLVMHRCFGFESVLEKQDAEEGFLEKVISWNKEGAKRDIRILIENYGFVWLPKDLHKDFVSSPIDHFFPWDMKRFIKKTDQLSLDHVGILLDIAHASLSCNMFNMLKNDTLLKDDRRFQNIFEDDLCRKDLLSVDDFILDSTHFFHISDTFTWEPADGIEDMKKYLYTENLPIGKGNLDFPGFIDRFREDSWMIMEIDPEDGNYADNKAQQSAIDYFMKVFKGR
jgi:sugar phosphate isomerase/epimerase